MRLKGEGGDQVCEAQGRGRGRDQVCVRLMGKGGDQGYVRLK